MPPRQLDIYRRTTYLRPSNNNPPPAIPIPHHHIIDTQQKKIPRHPQSKQRIMADPIKTLDNASRYCGVSTVSRKTYPIAGIQTTVYGLDELPTQTSDIACLWLLHPRGGTQERMTGIGTTIITGWNSRNPTKGLIAVAFDQRNHGTREVDPLANEAWRQGNPRHAQDMFSIFRELSHLLSKENCRL